MSNYKLDGLNLYDAFGFSVAAGSDDFLKLPTRKDPPSYKWPEDKTEYDLSDPAFFFTEATLEGILEASSESDFWSKYNSLRDLLTAPGERVIEVEELSQSYKVFYKNNPLTNRLTPIKGATVIVVKMSLKFEVIDFAEGFEPGGNGGFVQIKNATTGDIMELVQAPGIFLYDVIELSGIYDDGNGTYPNSIIDNS